MSDAASYDRMCAEGGDLAADIELDVIVLFERAGFDFETAEVKLKLDKLRCILANLRGVGQALKVKIG